MAISKAGIIDFLALYPSLIVDAEEKVVDAKQHVADVDIKFLPNAKKDLREAEKAVKTLQLQRQEYYELLNHLTLLSDSEVQEAVQFLKTYPSQYAELRQRELVAEQRLAEVMASVSMANMVDDFAERAISAKIKREQVEKKAFAMSELLRYAYHR